MLTLHCSNATEGTGLWRELCYDWAEMDGFVRRPVKTKQDFVKRYAQGEFGNCSPTFNTRDEFTDYYLQWDSAEDAHRSGVLMHLRNRVAGGKTYYDCSPAEIFRYWTLEDNPSQWYCSMMAPTPLTVIQGEVERTHRGLSLFYSLQKKPMREALKIDGKQVYGILARVILEAMMPLKDYCWLMYLLDAYPDHVVEFSTYDKEFGTVPGYKTCYWEVRKY